MKRQSFLKFCVATGTFLAGPLFSWTKGGRHNRIGKRLLVSAGRDRFDNPLQVFEGDQFYSKVSGRDTDGDLFIWELTRDKIGGPPLHYHVDVDEWWYVLEGEFLFHVGDEKFSAKKETVSLGREWFHMPLQNQEGGRPVCFNAFNRQVIWNMHSRLTARVW